MKFVIDEAVCEKHNLSVAEVLYILLLKECNGNTLELAKSMLESEKLSTGNIFDSEECTLLYPTFRWDDEVASILLESDESVPNTDRIDKLAAKMRELFPKGIKIGNSAWRGNSKEIRLRMQKFFKLYGNNYTDEQILNATKAYVESFNGNYTYMRILKYFILKSEVKKYEDEEGNILSQVEEVSELANRLENPEECTTNEDWQVELRR